MSSTRLVIGAIWVALVLVSRGIGSATAVPAAQQEYPDVAGEPQPLGLLDVYGNEVERAVSDYRLDLRGDVYERHAPETALPAPARPEA